MMVLGCTTVREYTTTEAAKKLGLLRPHLQRAIAQGKVPPPPLLKIGPIRVRLWSKRDIDRARRALEKLRRKPAKARREGAKRR